MCILSSATSVHFNLCPRPSTELCRWSHPFGACDTFDKASVALSTPEICVTVRINALTYNGHLPVMLQFNEDPKSQLNFASLKHQKLVEICPYFRFFGNLCDRTVLAQFFMAILHNSRCSMLNSLKVVIPRQPFTTNWTPPPPPQKIRCLWCRFDKSNMVGWLETRSLQKNAKN